MKKISMVAAFLMVLALATSAVAGPRYRFFDGKGHLDPAVIEALALTNEQTEKIQALNETAKKGIIPLKAQVTTKRAEMRLLWSQTTLDADKIKATQKELQALETQMRDIRTDMRIAFRKLLTPEQTSNLLAMGFGRDGRFKRGHGHGENKWDGRGKGHDGRNPGYQFGDCPGYKR
ncbi:MAG: Spy/CpxP family protein refolding chaperone [Deltaproteobacteria bacterium]|nr:Spy/CpxP family protein refolding chaperone [Deltaproteobacteria bacterium]